MLPAFLSLPPDLLEIGARWYPPEIGTRHTLEPATYLPSRPVTPFLTIEIPSARFSFLAPGKVFDVLLPNPVRCCCGAGARSGAVQERSVQEAEALVFSLSRWQMSFRGCCSTNINSYCSGTRYKLPFVSCFVFFLEELSFSYKYEAMFWWSSTCMTNPPPLQQ